MLISPVLITISSARLNRLRVRGWKEAPTLRKRFPNEAHGSAFSHQIQFVCFLSLDVRDYSSAADAW